MMSQDASFSDDDVWFGALIKRLSANEIAAQTDLVLRAIAGRLDEAQPAASVQSVSAGLLRFYVERACAEAHAASAEIRAKGAQTLHDLYAALGRRGAAAAAGMAAPNAVEVAGAPALPGIAVAESQTAASAIQMVYRLLCHREPAEEEIEIWRNKFRKGLAFHDFLLAMSDGPEAVQRRERDDLAPQMSDAEFIQAVYSILEGRGALPSEIDLFRHHLEAGGMTRATLVQNFFGAALARQSGKPEPLHDGLSCAVLGTHHVLTLAEWQEKARDSAALEEARHALRPATPFHFRAEAKVEISAIASLYQGGAFIEQFMDNITSQNGFDRHCELIIVDADSPENEAETIARYVSRHPGVRYQRMNARVGIYEAWNIGVQMARGSYLTNTNLDDLRRRDSFEIQAGALQSLPFVDVVYQDFYFSFDPYLDWEGVAAFGYKSDLPVITPYNMLRFNSPHNAPMWRKSLHDEVGLFDASFKSAGDYEFWMRCLAAGKTFYKINEPHVVYYQNPKGLSTRADTRGLIEARQILKKYAPKLIAPAFNAPLATYAAQMLGLPAEACAAERDRGMLAQIALRDLARRQKTALTKT